MVESEKNVGKKKKKWVRALHGPAFRIARVRVRRRVCGWKIAGVGERGLQKCVQVAN